MSHEPQGQPEETGAPSEALSETEERFCREYVDCLNATEAYLRVFPEVKRTTAATLGWRLLREVEIEATKRGARWHETTVRRLWHQRARYALTA